MIIRNDQGSRINTGIAVAAVISLITAALVGCGTSENLGGGISVSEQEPIETFLPFGACAIPIPAPDTQVTPIENSCARRNNPAIDAMNT